MKESQTCNIYKYVRDAIMKFSNECERKEWKERKTFQISRNKLERMRGITSCHHFETMKAHWKIHNENIKHIVEPENGPNDRKKRHYMYDDSEQSGSTCVYNTTSIGFDIPITNTWFHLIRSCCRRCVEGLFIVKLSLISSFYEFRWTPRLWFYLWTTYIGPSDNIRNLLPLLLYDICI